MQKINDSFGLVALNCDFLLISAYSLHVIIYLGRITLSYQKGYIHLRYASAQSATQITNKRFTGC